jgi:hypothetical protein
VALTRDLNPTNMTVIVPTLAKNSSVFDQPFLVSWPVLWIRDVYPGSQIWDPDFYPSRIQKQQQKRGVKKICCHTFICSHKFHKIENYFIFGKLKKTIWANFQRIIELFT